MSRAGQLSSDLKAARLATGLNQSELAAAIGVEQATISRWERGTEPTLENLGMLARFFNEKGIEFSYLKSIASDMIMSQIRERIQFVPIVGILGDRGKVKAVKDNALRDMEVPFAASEITRAVRVDTDDHNPYFQRGAVLYFEDGESGYGCPSGRLGFGRGDGKDMFVGELYQGNNASFHSIRTPTYSTAGLYLRYSSPVWLIDMRL